MTKQIKLDITPCPKCYCMTKSIEVITTNGLMLQCGKCKADKTLSDVNFYKAQKNSPLGQNPVITASVKSSDKGTKPKDTIQSIREELEYQSKYGTDIEIDYYKGELEGFNLGVSLAQKEFLDFLEDLLKADIHKEPYQFLKYSILETKIKMVCKIEELKKSLSEEK